MNYNTIFIGFLQAPCLHFEIGGTIVLIKKLEFLGRNWYLFSKSKNVGGAIAPLAPPPTRALFAISDSDGVRHLKT